MKILIMNESREGHYYSHWTNLNGLVGILQSNSLFGSNDGTHHLKNVTNVSLSRLGNGTGVPDFIKKDGTVASVRIVLDIGKLEKKYKISPIEYFNDPKDRDTLTQRATGDSEYEEAVVVGNTQKLANITDSSGKFLGSVVIDFKKNKIAKVLDSEGNKISKNEEDKYELGGNLYSIKIQTTKSGRIYGIELTGNSSSISIDEDEFEDYNKGSIKNIKDFIIRIELADILFDNKKEYLVRSKDNEFIDRDEYLSRILREGHTSGLNSDEYQSTVNHGYTTFGKFLSFIERELGRNSIKKFETPKSFYSVKGNVSKGEYSVISNVESDNNLYLSSIKNKKSDREEFRLVPAISDRKAIQSMEDYYLYNNNFDVDSIKLLPFYKIRFIENEKYKILPLLDLKKLLDKKYNCKSYFDFIKTLVKLGIENKFDLIVISHYSEGALAKKIKIDRDNKIIKVK